MTTAVVSFVAAEAAGGFSPELCTDELQRAIDSVQTRDSRPDLWLYRERTVGLLKRYLRLSVEVGRLPSLLGREFFRTRVTSYSVSTFEDAVIFVHDVERSLEKLDEFEKELIAKIVLQDYSQEEAAHLLGCWRRTVGRRYPEALDRLSEIFLEGGLLQRLPDTNQERPESCQEGKTEEILLSDYIQAE
jgi:DNA-directed RNA polymerase specialized sigma24 family protein